MTERENKMGATKNDKPNCSDCKHVREIPGDAHKSCSNASATVVGHETGIRRGWFTWPVNFDPAWLISCNGFEAKEPKAMAEETRERPVKEPHPVKQEYTVGEVESVITPINDIASCEGWMVLAVSSSGYQINVELDQFVPWNSDDDEREEDDAGEYTQSLQHYLLQELEKYAMDILSVVERVRNPQPE